MGLLWDSVIKLKFGLQPLDRIDKSNLIKMGYEYLGDKIFQTWSCYSDGINIGERRIHCGICESCINRRKAFKNSNIRDKTEYAYKR